MKTIFLSGTVVPGVGGGKHYIDAPAVRQQVEEKLGFKPHPGTMNIRLTGESEKNSQELHQSKENGITPKVGLFPGALLKAEIDSFPCAIIHPEDPNYPTDIIEIIAPVNLRKELGLFDGSQVTIKVDVT